MEHEQELRWLGSSCRDLLAFREEPRRRAAFQYRKIQAGLDPDDWNPFDSIGAGARESRIRNRKASFA
jgi:phage-related protein